MNRIAAELTGRGTTATRERPLAEVLPTSNQRIGEPLQDPFTRFVANKAELELASQRILLRADGTSITIDENATPMRRADGTLAGVVVSFRESNVRQAANAELQADQRKDDFFAILAHELRNPLAPIRNALQIMQVVQDDGATTSAARVIIERQLKHLTRLIDDLLDMSRITQGTFELSKERTALSDIIHLALDIARPQLEGSSTLCRSSWPPRRSTSWPIPIGSRRRLQICCTTPPSTHPQERPFA